MLQETPRAKGAEGIGPIAVPKEYSNAAPTLDDLGLTRKESAEAQMGRMLQETPRQHGARGSGLNQYEVEYQNGTPPPEDAPRIKDRGGEEKQVQPLDLLSSVLVIHEGTFPALVADEGGNFTIAGLI